MGDTITKKDLEEILDKKLDQKLGQYQSAVIEAVDFKFQSLEQIMELIKHNYFNIEARGLISYLSLR